ncbi:hypothetical protein QN362_10320 [Actimicrobium sp. CCC2.4]|uniref:hypothetical protein n=1 Tax=Actimicrobium sp. CCC2.4 TaxID=3048606 RepID=UPI002AC99A25|nr:hypothetical protein [Actimicrobium sp. CCC2.4]MEB0135722.1 hypothetical protein [Actimicrobium sp. CCC2.4]WPX33721.1 hypothetical protein RHM62_07850 [Actimicrobium sp. CCC2.4]
MNTAFIDLMRAVGDAFGVPEPEKLADGAAISINNIVFSFEKTINNPAELVTLFVDFGPVPKGNEAAVYYHLLQENYLEFPTQNATYCVSSRTGNVVYASAWAIDKLHADVLISKVKKLVDVVSNWRTDNADGRLNIAPRPMRRPAFLAPLPRKNSSPHDPVTPTPYY